MEDPPDTIMAKVKTLKPDFLEAKGLQTFYKSYNFWEKMMAEQCDKAAAWLQMLPPSVQGFTIYLLLLFLLRLIIFSFGSLLFLLQLLYYRNQEWKPVTLLAR
jgi:hypothetical protein